MEPYKNLNGDSGISAYELGEDFIRVKFKDGKTYRYSYQSASPQDVEKMKKLAISGKGLNSYIMKHVKDLFE